MSEQQENPKDISKHSLTEENKLSIQSMQQLTDNTITSFSPNEKDNNNTDIILIQDAQESYNQTHEALREALSEQTLLKERLRSLEIRNQPARFGEPVSVRSISSTRGSINEEDATPERILFELAKAVSLLDNAKLASDTSEIELAELQKTLANYKKQSVIDTENIIAKNAHRHKVEMQHEQQIFHEEILKWNQERALLLTEAEKYSMISQSSIHKAAEIAEEVESQRKKIQKLSAELRNCLAKSKQIKEQLDQDKKKLAMIQNLKDEIEANTSKTAELEKTLAEQRQVLRAVKISAQAQSILDENDAQIADLKKSKKEANNKLKEAERQQYEIDQLELDVLRRIEEATRRFQLEQSQMFVLESDIREMKSEYAKKRQAALDQGKKQVELQCQLKGEKINAAQRFIIENVNQIHRVDRVQSTLLRVKNKLQSRPSTAVADGRSNTSQTTNSVRTRKPGKRPQTSQQKSVGLSPSGTIKISKQSPNNIRKVSFKVSETPRKITVT